ncbi:hypothetical protein [Aliishimia ponticola]|nr:hypothetical protein [Aliishimia ponticola]
MRNLPLPVLIVAILAIVITIGSQSVPARAASEPVIQPKAAQES